MFKPLNDRVLIKPDEVKDTTESGIVLLDNQKEKPVKGVVVVGGKLVKKGDKVLFSKFGYDEVELDKKIHYVVSESTLLGIF